IHGVVAEAGRWVADTRGMARCLRRAADLRAADAHAVLACVALGTKVTIVAHRAGEQRADAVHGGAVRLGAGVADTGVARLVAADAVHAEAAGTRGEHRAWAARGEHGRDIDLDAHERSEGAAPRHEHRAVGEQRRRVPLARVVQRPGRAPGIRRRVVDLHA